MDYKLQGEIMFRIKRFIFLTSIGFLTASSLSFAFNEEVNERMKKTYVPLEDIVLHDGRIYVLNDNALSEIKTFHQDENGLYFFRAGWFGSCPNGHPYGIGEGCYGPECPYSNN